jgi:predicted MFS family arabinose efflux permease
VRTPEHAVPAALASAVWGYVFAGLSASLVGIGLARFAYTPLIPALIRAHWFAAADVVYLSAANLAGYLIGAVAGRPLAGRASNAWVLRLMMLAVSLSLAACAFPWSLAWFFIWRLISGIGGGAIMVVVTATVLPHIPPARRGAAAGFVFLGVGLGIAFSGTLVPLLLTYSLRITWLGLAAVAGVLTAATWAVWPQGADADDTVGGADEAPQTRGADEWPVYVEYALMAIGLVAPMVFLVDFVARGLGAGEGRGALIWIFYGAGAIAGPLLYGAMADRAGVRIAARVLLAVQTLAMLGLTMTDDLAVLCALSVILGTFPPGIVPLVLSWIRECFADDAQRQSRVWGRATITFAAIQALAAYGFSALFTASNDYGRLFVLGAGALAAALLLDLSVARPPAGRGAPPVTVARSRL